MDQQQVNTSGVSEVAINGQNIRLRFGYGCFKSWTLACVENQLLTSLDTVEGAAKLIQCAYNNECLVKETAPVHNYEFFYDWVESKVNTDDSKEITNLLQVWSASIATQKSLKKLEEYAEEQKKSQMIAA